MSKRTQPYLLLRFMQERLNACNQLSIVENELSKLYDYDYVMSKVSGSPSPTRSARRIPRKYRGPQSVFLHPVDCKLCTWSVDIDKQTKEETTTTKIPSNQELLSSLESFFGSSSVFNKQERSDRGFHSC